MGILRPDSQRWNTISAASLYVCARSRHTPPQHQMDLARQGLGISSDIVMASQPLGLSGPKAQGHLMTTETHEEGLILPQAPKMNNHEVQSCSDPFENITSMGLQSGSIPFGKSPICWRVTNLSEFIATQVLCQSGLFLKHEANAKTLVARYRDDGIPFAINGPFCCTDWETICAVMESWLTNLKFSFLMEMTEVLQQVLSQANRPHV